MKAYAIFVHTTADLVFSLPHIDMYFCPHLFHFPLLLPYCFHAVPLLALHLGCSIIHHDLYYQLTFHLFRLIRVITIQFWELTSNPYLTGSHLNTGLQKLQKSSNILQLRWLWCSRHGYSPSLLSSTSYLPDLPLYWHILSFRVIWIRLSSVFFVEF